MNFDNEKKQCMQKLVKFDNSKKGHIDKDILPLVKKINSHPDYYTTSSCAGRIMVIKPSEVKHKAEWVFSSHDYPSYEDIIKNLDNLPKARETQSVSVPQKSEISGETLWLRMEPPILHIACRTMDSADELLKKANAAGFRRPSILGFKKRIIVEIMIPSKMDVPISKYNKLLIDETYLRFLIQEASLKLKKSRKKLKKIDDLFS